MKNTSLCLSAILAAGLCAGSCVDPAYDLSNLNTEVNLPPVELPIGSVNNLTLGDILKIEDEDGIIRVRENGDYYLYFEGEPVVQKIELNVKHIDGVKVEESPFYATAPATISLDCDFGIVSDIPVETKFEVKVTAEDFPAEVTRVFYIDGNGDIVLKISYDGEKVPFSKVVLENVGIEFPEWAVFESVTPEGFTVSGNTVSGPALEVQAGKTAEIVCKIKGIDFSKVPEGQGIVDDGTDEEGNPRRKLVVDDDVILRAGMKVSSADRTSTSGSFRSATLAKSLEISEITINSVRAGFDVSRTVEGTTVDLGDIPEEFRSADTRIDPYELRLFFDLDNGFPVGASLYTGITALGTDSDGSATERFMEVGSAEDPIFIAPGGTTGYCFYLREPSGRQGYTEKKIDKLGDFLYPIPSTLEIDQIHVSAKADDITIPIEDSYDVTVNYRIDAPLAFGENMSIDFEYELDNLKVNLGDNVSFSEADVKFDVVNTLPISFGLSAEVIGDEGNVIPGIKIALENAGQDGLAPISAGSLSEPATAPMKLKLTVDEGQTINFSGIRLNLQAGDPKVGAVLNENMGLSIRNASVNLSSGVTIDAGGVINK